jgi:hypothetical protein
LFLTLQVSYDPFWPSFLCEAPLTTLPCLFAVATMGRREATVSELVAQAEFNGYKRRAHKEKDIMRRREKYVKKTKKDQDATLKRFIL